MALLIVCAYIILAISILCAGKRFWTGYQRRLDLKTIKNRLAISPVHPNFNWQTTEPATYLPFKKEYKFTMALRRLPVEEWFLIENTYKSRIQERKKIMENFWERCFLCHESSHRAIEELYRMMTCFLMSRYPMIFSNSEKDSSIMYNHITGDQIPISPRGIEPEQLLLNLSKSVEEDIIILMKDPIDNLYKLRATIWCFPGGFDPSSKFNKSMHEIHKPVPQLNQKLGLSIDRHFGRMKSGDYVIRNNWAVQTHTELFLASDSHFYSSDETLKPLEVEAFDYEKIHVRSERQVLTKLPESEAIIFTIRTYLLSLGDIKNQGLSESFFSAIDGLPDDFGCYKRRPEWRNMIADYLVKRNGVRK